MLLLIFVSSVCSTSNQNVFSTQSRKEIDISAFISVTSDPFASGKFTSGRSLVTPDKLQIKDVLQGFKSPLIKSAPEIAAVANDLLSNNELGSIVFVSPELGRWSTVGGLGVMVDELTRGLAQLGTNVTVITPYFERNRGGQTGYLAKDNIHWKR